MGEDPDRIRREIEETRAQMDEFITSYLATVTSDPRSAFHFRERGQNGTLLGLFIQDAREAGKSKVYLAERGNALATTMAVRVDGHPPTAPGRLPRPVGQDGVRTGADRGLQGSRRAVAMRG